MLKFWGGRGLLHVGGWRVADLEEAMEMLEMTNGVLASFVPASSFSHQSLSFLS